MTENHIDPRLTQLVIKQTLPSIPLSHPLVEESCQNLLKAVQYLAPANRAAIVYACYFGDIAHIKDKRKSGEPYITHPIAVAEILAGFRLDKDTLIAAILHDTVEDTAVTLQLLEDKFGEKVARLVDGVTKLKSSNMSKQESQAATFHKIITATIADPRVLLIKLSDRLHNMSTLDAVAPDKQKRTAKETLSFYVPFARTLGLNDIADYIELLCYRNLDSQMYTKFSDKLLQHGLGRQFQKVSIQTRLQKILTELNLDGVVQVLDNRTSMYRQFFKNRGDINRLIHQYEFEIVTDTIEACDKLAKHLIETYSIGNDQIFDHIRKPMPGGNQSLTLIYDADFNHIKITLLTRRMQKAARLGIMGHDNEMSQLVIQASLQNMQDLLEDDTDTISTINGLLGYLNSRKILCYSPQGRAYELPRGATALDFAYAVGPMIGNIAVGAMVNGIEGKLGQPLAAGDTVIIHTDKDAHPKAEWLGFAVTSKARKEILKVLKHLPNDDKITHGKDALDRALKTYQKSLSSLSAEDWQTLLEWRGLTDQDALFLQIADGVIVPQLVVSRLFSDVVDESDSSAPTQTRHLLAGVKGVEVEFAKCCNPIYGDKIVGHLSKNGLSVHRHKCYSLNAIAKDNPYQIIQLSWRAPKEGNRDDTSVRFSAFLRVFKLPSEEQMSQIIYEMRLLNIGVESTDLKDKDGKNAGTTLLHLVVSSREHLAAGIEAIRRLLGYPNVMRLYHHQAP